MSLIQNTIGQFTCALAGSHKVSIKDEERLYSSEKEELDTVCERCGMPIRLKIDEKDRTLYKIILI